MSSIPATMRDSSLSSSTHVQIVSPLLRKLIMSSVVSLDAWEKLPLSDRNMIQAAPDDDEILTTLVGLGLLTPYQAGKVRSGHGASLILGNYRILDKIGSGGMGVVFRAEHHKLRQPVAVKALQVSGERSRRALERFFVEVKVVSQLRHPHIVAAIDAGEQAGAGPEGASVPYFVMEYVEGRNLEDWVADQGPLPIETACLIAHQLADGLTEAHRHDVIHRDVKPGNVIVDSHGSAKLLDFGVARLPAP
ncbi:MAG: serine/threonine-protein kinase, partial [Gemmataceae bacterium]